MIKSNKIKYTAKPIESLDDSVSEINSSSVNTNKVFSNVRDLDDIDISNVPIRDTSNIFTTKYTRDFYRGKSFHYAGDWTIGVHYVDDFYSTDFVSLENTLLVCTNGNFSSLSNKPILNYNSRGDVISVTSDYWKLVLTGIHGKSPGIRINPETGHWEICEDTSVENPVWVDTGFGDYMPISGGTFTGNVVFSAGAEFAGSTLNMRNNRIKNVADPVDAFDAVTKRYLEEKLSWIN